MQCTHDTVRPTVPNIHPIDPIEPDYPSLTAILTSPDYGGENGLRDQFVAFLSAHQCLESFLFWCLCNEFDTHYNSTPPGDAQWLQQATRVCEQFIREGAPQQVNLDARTRIKVLNDVDDHIGGPVFREAKDRAFRLMDRDGYPRFILQLSLEEDNNKVRQTHTKWTKTRWFAGHKFPTRNLHKPEVRSAPCLKCRSGSTPSLSMLAQRDSTGEKTEPMMCGSKSENNLLRTAERAADKLRRLKDRFSQQIRPSGDKAPINSLPTNSLSGLVEPSSSVGDPVICVGHCATPAIRRVKSHGSSLYAQRKTS